ncbi:uncharacterized protein LOC125214879 [Salvia hispanica]|uniref:uncharacterized protein LOC125214879 n=1 Tax=Salvia hispanica TaxID=49212 RepID=UPI0020099CC1|nr:uncharacterized protein LOC125214879 [Salvia hispanica]
MPGMVQKNNVCGGSNYHNQLHKFWCELSTQARQKLMRIDKQTLFEHARKNLYCSRCNGLLLESFLQIVMYGKSLQQNCGNLCIDNECQDNVIDPSIHPWGGLTTSREGTLTLLDCYLHSKSLKGLQNVFDSARGREKQRKLLYPNACGGGGRGWISQGITGYGKVHVTRETCALHTARLSVETLVNFWSSLRAETQQSLLRMKEEDFIERLMFRFDSKRFCRDCRKNVIREFKELKELKRMRKDPRCTSWLCAADSAFQYEVSHDTVRADWHQTFSDACGTYHHFEWAIGTGEGKSDILDFKNVGLRVRVQVTGVDLSGLSACYITLRAWKMDGRCNELCVKAHALQAPQCAHCRLAVGDGYVRIIIGGNIKRFFEHAEEAKEEEDDDSLDKDGNELDGECSRPQKHAKSPALAREFLLDAATVIFKEQVEKAFREGTAQKNAQSIFVCLALELLEERVHVACKEIITLEKQMKLLEEEEKEKREDEERKERRRTKEREKKVRRKERIREKENKERRCAESNTDPVALDTRNEAEPCSDDGVNVENTRDCTMETGEAASLPSPLFPDIQDEEFFMDYSSPNVENHLEDILEEESGITRDFKASLPYNHCRYSRRKPRLHKDTEQDLTSKWSDRRKGSAMSESEVTTGKYESRIHADGFYSTRSNNCFDKQLRTNAAKLNTRYDPKLSEKLQCRVGDRCDSHVCSCNHPNDYRARPESHTMRSTGEPKYENKLESCDISKSYHRGKCTQVECAREINGQVKAKVNCGNSPVTKKVWEPLDSQKKLAQSNSGSDVALKPKVETTESDQVTESSGTATSCQLTDTSIETNTEDDELGDFAKSGNGTCTDTEKGLYSMKKSENYIKVEEPEDGELYFMDRPPLRTEGSLLSRSSNSRSCSSCLSEGDSNTFSLNHCNLESTSTSDSEESSQTSEGREMLHESRITECHKVVDDRITTRAHDSNNQELASLSSLPAETAIYCKNGKADAGVDAQPQIVLPTMMQNQSLQYPIYQAQTMAYYHQAPVSWPANPTNGLMSFHYPNHYLYPDRFGYDLNTNAQLMQYGGLQHLPPPLITSVHMPVLPTVANVVCTKDYNIDSSVAEDNRCEKRSDEFSLFHFGGPVGFKTEEAVTLKDGRGGDSSEKSPHPCNAKESIEEYNLFAASNGIKFSIF